MQVVGLTHKHLSCHRLLVVFGCAPKRFGIASFLFIYRTLLEYRRNTDKKIKLQTVERLTQFSNCISSNKRLLNFENALETAFEGGAN